jgi:3-oxoacyl-[acyl-carrier protein] reductase
MSMALITGASRGIGRAISVALATDGFDLALAYAGDTAAARATQQMCLEAARTAGHADARAELFQADIASAPACEELFEAARTSLGDPAILVNNAGITRDNLLMRMSPEDFDAVIAVNLRAAFLFTRLACRPMMKQRKGRIINITSIVGLGGNIGQANYAASKAGLIGLTKTAAKEVATRGITVNAIAPGFIATDMTGALDDKTRESFLATIPLGRPGTPEDVAALAAFLASDAAAYITGQVIPVDGGMTI